MSCCQPTPIRPLGSASGAGLLRGRHDKILFQQSASAAGSIFNQSLEDELDLEEEYSDNFAEDENHDLGFEDVAIGQRELRRSASSTMTLAHSNTVSGGRVDGGGGGATVTIEAIFDSNTLKGDVVYVSGNGHVDLAQANADPQAKAIGIATSDVAEDGTGEYLTMGPFTNESWSLTPGTIYFLDPDVAGGLTATCPTTNGDYVIIIGTATTPTQINVEIHWAMVLES